MKIKDERYHIGLEFCGKLTQRQVLRFCGDFVADFETIEQAETGAVMHAETRGHNSTGWRVAARLDSALWLVRNCGKGVRHRIAYGADVAEFTGSDSDIEAAKQFGLCVRHQIECSGGFESAPVAVAAPVVADPLLREASQVIRELVDLTWCTAPADDMVEEARAAANSFLSKV